MASFNYSTVAQLRARMRQEFKTATGRRLHRIATWMNANLTDAQLKNIFSLTDPQTAALRTKLQNMAARLAAFDAEVGS